MASKFSRLLFHRRHSQPGGLSPRVDSILICPGGELVEAYGPTIGIATAIIALGIAVTTALGPEKRGRSLEAAGPAGANRRSTAF